MKLPVRWTLLVFMWVVAASLYAATNGIYGKYGWAIFAFNVMIFLVELSRNIVEWVKQ